jgi:formiminoglutamase
VLGAPLNHSISPGRCDLAPRAIREVLGKFSPYDAEHGHDLSQIRVHDAGDLNISHLKPEDAAEPLGHAVAEAWNRADAVILLGGDNGITRPACLGAPVPLDRLGLVTLDAHLDLRDLDGGLINGNPIRALLEDGLPGANIVQIGIQAFANSAHYAEVGRRAGIRMITAEQALATDPAQMLAEALEDLAPRVDAIYFDLDVDVLDRTFAPACPGARPGGLMPWQVRKCAYIAGRHPKVRAMDLVEVDPEHDHHDLTCMAAASFLLAFASGLCARS